jgi:hypothetical protein
MITTPFIDMILYKREGKTFYLVVFEIIIIEEDSKQMIESK